MHAHSLSLSAGTRTCDTNPRATRTEGSGQSAEARDLESQAQNVLPLKALQKSLGSKCLSKPPQGLVRMGWGQFSQHRRGQG